MTTTSTPCPLLRSDPPWCSPAKARGAQSDCTPTDPRGERPVVPRASNAKRRSRWGAGIAFGLSLALVACGRTPKSDAKDSAGSARAANAASAATSQAEPASAAGDASGRVGSGGPDELDKVLDPKGRSANGGHGRFVYQFEPPKEAAHASVEPLFRDARLPAVIDAMKAFELPRDVPVIPADVGPCASPNAFYMPGKHAVFLCYPMAKAAFENFVAMGKSPQEASNLTRDAMTFILLHELGHALIGELNLGVTGKEEDAVDELAALILIQNAKHDMAIAGTYSLVLLNHFQGKGHKTPYFDEHSISEARLYDIFCMILGSNPEKFGPEILREHPELRARAPKCPATYEKIDRAWTTMLAPHMRAASR